MSSTPLIDDDLRARIIAKPDSILDDIDVMRALVAANDKERGDNIVDLRGIAMDRLERRLDRLEDTHRCVISAAYENLAGTNQVHRAVLRLLEQRDFSGFMSVLADDVAGILRVDCVRLVLESTRSTPDPTMERLGDVLSVAPPGFIDRFLAGTRGAESRPVILRRVQEGLPPVYGPQGSAIRSEACMQLDLGSGRLPALLVMGAHDADTFTPQQGTDLLEFFAGVFERQMRGWLA